MLGRRPVPDGGGLLGVTETRSDLALLPRMIGSAGGFFESWDAVVYGESEVFLLSLGLCRSSSEEEEDELSFCRAEVVRSSGEYRMAQIGSSGIAASPGSPDVEITAGGSWSGSEVAYVAGCRSFEPAAYRGGKGSASLGQWGTEGRMGSRDAEISWAGKIAGPGGGPLWDLLIPQLPIVPRRWMCLASAQGASSFEGEFSAADGSAESVECAGSPMLFMRRWGTAHPIAWARLVGTFGVDGSPGGDPASPALYVSGAWVKMGRLGVLGPPAPKTFFTIHLSSEFASRIGIEATKISFNALPRALLCSSHTVFPRWEARLLGREVVATLLVDVSGSEPFQQELPDPEGVGAFIAQFPYPGAEIVLETNVKGAWRHAATLTSDHTVLEFGGREALPYLPFLPKEYALGMDG